jgi:hypothetical protein
MFIFLKSTQKTAVLIPGMTNFKEKILDSYYVKNNLIRLSKSRPCLWIFGLEFKKKKYFLFFPDPPLTRYTKKLKIYGGYWACPKRKQRN